MEKELFDYYKLAIDARDKLNENYHKWMTFYYVANGAILVAVTALVEDCSFLAILPLSLVGTMISIFWHLSCKGYYYWSYNWIEIIKAHERKLLKGREDKLIGIYSIFSEEVHDKEEKNKVYGIINYKSISTPKLTLIFSFIAILLWIGFGVIFFWIKCNLPLLCKSLISILGLIIFLLLYPYFINKVQSKENDSHRLVNLGKYKK